MAPVKGYLASGCFVDYNYVQIGDYIGKQKGKRNESCRDRGGK